MDKKVALIKLIKQCDLLTNEAKIKLIEKVNIFTDEEIGQLGKLIATEIRFGKNHKNLLIKEVLHILEELEKKL